MQLSIITNEQDIHAAQRLLQDRIRAEGAPLRRYRIGNRRGQGEVDVCYVERVGLWHAVERLDNRWSNGFGLEDPTAVPMLTVVAWINPAFDGSRRTGAGAFFRDVDGHTWLAHSGRIGGGKKGIGRTAFLDGFSGSIQTVEGSDYVVIGRMDAADFLDELAAFVRAVQAFKIGIGGLDDRGEDEDEDEIDGDDAEHDDANEDAWDLDAVFTEIDAAGRRALMEWLGAAIGHAHAQGPSCWAVTRRSGPRLRLLVGNAVAFEIGRGRVGVGLLLPSLPASVDASADAGKPDYVFVRMDGGVLRRFSTAKFIALGDGLHTAAMRFIEQAARAYRRSPYARYHVPELLHAISELLGAPLPDPAHAATAPSYWKVAPGEKARLWPQCRDGGYIAIGWDELGDLSGLDREGFDARVDEALAKYPHWKRRGVEQAWRFLNIPPGARIVANDGIRRVVGIGTVTGPYHYVDEGTGFAHRLPVRWDDVRERVVEQPGWLRTIIQLSAASFAAIIDAPSPGEDLPEPPPPEAEPEEKIDFGGIVDRLEDAGLRFPDEIVASYLLALQAKRFVILSGISGTGKTQLALAIAKVFQPLNATAVIAVRPDWTDNRGLLGYHNPITGSYQTTPFLRLLLAAADEEARAVREGRPRLPFFVVLDEMNLARVEHYFSDFLSCLESGEPLHLHDDPQLAQGASENREAVPMQLSIPRNLFFTGTVNVDETTYMFSPKVLDRAFVLEFNDVDLGSLGAGTGDDAGSEASVLQLRHFAGALDIRDKPSPADYVAFRELAGGALHHALTSLNERLQIDHRHFGYRVANEIARFVGLAEAQAGKDPTTLWEAFDVAVVAKVLPKLHGTQQELEDVLSRLLAFAVDVESPVDAREHEPQWSYVHGSLSPRSNGPSTAPKLPRAAAKLWRMLRRIRQQGYVSFIE